MAGAIKDVSIGFIAKEREGNVISKSEMIECSFVVVGSNRGAKLKEILGSEYVKMKDAGIITEEADTDKKEFTYEEFKSMQSDISEIKTFLKTLVDGKTKSKEELESKELVQSAVRSLNEALRGLKQR